MLQLWAAVLLGSFLSVAHAQSPVIVTQPGNLAMVAGDTASFSVAVSGIGPFTYQWQCNGTNLPDNVITTVTGGGINILGDGGAATNAELSSPWGVAVDAFGNLFIADEGNQRIREVGADGIITTVAGNGNPGYSGYGGAATNAELNDASGVAADAFGNLFIADGGNNVVLKVGTNEIISTVAGNGFDRGIGGGYSGDGGAATNAELNDPTGVAVDASGNLFIADYFNQCIRKAGFLGATLALNNVGAANAGVYSVVVSSPYGSVSRSFDLAVVLQPLNALIIGGQGVQLQFQGVPGSSYVLLSAASLTPPVNWIPVSTNAADVNGNWTFTVTTFLSNTARFYRMTTAGQ